MLEALAASNRRARVTRATQNRIRLAGYSLPYRARTL